jgi:hypothetical protein
MDATATDAEVWKLIEGTLCNSESIKAVLSSSGRLDLVDHSDILNKTTLIEVEIQNSKSDLKRFESSLIELETDKILNEHSENVYQGIRKNLISKINQTKVLIERCQNEIYLLQQNNNWVDSIDNIGGLVKDLNKVDESHKRDVLKKLVKDIIVSYNQDEKYHNLKVNLKVPLVMDIDRDAQASRTPSWGGERVKASKSSKPKSGLDYSTVTDLARFRG